MCLLSCSIPPVEINSAEVFVIYRAITISISSPAICAQPIIFESDSAKVVKWCNDVVGGLGI